MTVLCFIDTETTGLDPDRHEIWEVGLILPDGAEHEWQLPVDLSRADPMALNIGRFHERRVLTTPKGDFAKQFVRLTRGLHLCGAVVSFDTDRLWRLLRANGECPMWHYHVIDVEALAAGWLRGFGRAIARSAPGTSQECDHVPSIAAWRGALDRMETAKPPWKSTDLSLAIGVDPERFDRHTALGDARWAKAMYDAVMGAS